MGLGSIISGGINASRALPTTDYRALFDTINKAGAQKEELINKLPAELKPLYSQYEASLGAAGEKLQTARTDIGQNLLEKTQALYDPNSAAVQATLAALKTQDYSTLPGTLKNLRAQLAATGGLGRGGAETALTSAVMAPAATFAQQAGQVQAQQLQSQQTNVQAALNKIAAMDEGTAQELFGMSKEQATQILTYGRDDLKTKMSDLVANIDTKAQQTLGLQKAQADEAYKNALTRLAQKNALTADITDTGISALTAAVSGGMGGGGASGAGMGFLKGLGLPGMGA